MDLTGIPEIDQVILLNLDYPSLNRVCQSNRYLNTLCMDDLFWKEKFIHDFGQLSWKSNDSNHKYYKVFYDKYIIVKSDIQTFVDRLRQYYSQGKLKPNKTQGISMSTYIPGSSDDDIYLMLSIFNDKWYINDKYMITDHNLTTQFLTWYLKAFGIFPNEIDLFIDGDNRSSLYLA